MLLLVDDLDAWWAHLDGLSLDKRFGLPPPRMPKLEPWGLRVCCVWDPWACSGILRPNPDSPR
jgi:hypothetical protein